MDINLSNTYFIPVILLLVLGLTSFSCLTEDKEYLTVDFELPVSVYPVKEEYLVGDTIFLEVDFPKVQEAINEDFTYSFENYDFFGWIRCTRLMNPENGLSDQPGGLSGFTVQNYLGGFYPFSDAGAEMKFLFKNDKYSMKTALILRKSGIYFISFGTNNGIYNEDFQRNLNVPGKVVGVGSIHYLINGGSGNNNHLIFENTINKPKDDDEKAGWKQFFSFKVVD